MRVWRKVPGTFYLDVGYLASMGTTAPLRRIRILLLFFIIGLVVSGLTAIPLRFELSVLDSLLGERTEVDPTPWTVNTVS